MGGVYKSRVIILRLLIKTMEFIMSVQQGLKMNIKQAKYMAYQMIISMIKTSSRKTEQTKKIYLKSIRGLITEIHTLETSKSKEEKIDAKDKVILIFEKRFSLEKNKKERQRLLANKRQMARNKRTC
tara:strand:+ start:101 stop:481 length:381 start_codon:yes stop_codon:yes gene_type:complete